MNRIQEQVHFSKSKQQWINKIQKVQQHETLALKTKWHSNCVIKVLSEDKTATHLYLKFSHVMQLIAMIKHVFH